MISNKNEGAKLSSTVAQEINSYHCSQQAVYESPLMKNNKNSIQVVTPIAFNIKQIDQMRLS